jgi:hypothetical protein
MNMQDADGVQLDDGTTLTFEEKAQNESLTEWVLTGSQAPEAGTVSVAQAMSIAGDEYADYVSVRTRSEVAWLRLVSEWFAEQAERLDGELRAAHS